MPSDMNEKISNEQLSLLNELYKNEGTPAVLRYLVDHEKIEISVAKRWIVALGFKDDSCKDCTLESPKETLESYAHYCMFCNDTWAGPENSLCPLCKTDGYNKKPTFMRKVLKKLFLVGSNKMYG